MKKTFLLMLAATAFCAAADNQTLTLTFNRPDNTGVVAEVQTTASGIDGVQATLTGVAPSLRIKGDKGDDYATPAATLLPNRNSNSTSTSARNSWTFSLAGLPEGKVIRAIAITVDGLTGGGESQSTKVAINRQVNVDALCSPANGTLTKFAEIVSTDLLTGGRFINADGEEIDKDVDAYTQSGSDNANTVGWKAGVRRLSNTHTLSASSDAPETSADMTLELQMWKGTVNGGCFYGLSEIVLTLSDPEVGVDEDAINAYKQALIDKLSDIAVLDSDAVANTINNVDVSEAANTAAAKRLVDEAANTLWDSLAGAYFTFRNMPCTDEYSDVYLSSALNTDNFITVAQGTPTQTEAWQLESAGDSTHNAFYIKNCFTNTYLSKTATNKNGSLYISLTNDADDKAIFTLVPYTDKDHHSGALGIKCTNCSNEQYSYLQCPAGAYPIAATSTENLTAVNTTLAVNWWYNYVEPGSNYNELHPSSFKGRWLMAAAPDDITTSIREINADSTDRPTGTYDMLGRKLAVPVRGICIVNGRITIVR